MNNYDAQCIGQYTKYYIINRGEFINKVQEGMSIEEYWDIQKNTRKLYFTTGTQNSKNPFLSYRFEVKGKTYYGTSKIGYSRDIHARMAGKPCKVYYQSANPYLSCPGDMNSDCPDDTAQPLSIAAMVTGILSFLFSFVPFLSIITGFASLALGLYALRRKKTINPFAYAGIICSGIALLIGVISTFLLIAFLILSLFMAA